MTEAERYAARTGHAAQYVRLVGRRITRHRQARGWSQRKLGALCGHTGAAVGMWERGLTLPKLETMLVIAHALEVHPDELFRFKSELEE